MSIEAVTIWVGSSIDQENPVSGAENSAFDCRVLACQPAHWAVGIEHKRVRTHILQSRATDESTPSRASSARADETVPGPTRPRPVILLRDEVPEPERLGTRREHLPLFTFALSGVRARSRRETPAQSRRCEPDCTRRVEERRSRDGAERARSRIDALPSRPGPVRRFRIRTRVVFEIGKRRVNARDRQVVCVIARVFRLVRPSSSRRGSQRDARFAVGPDGEAERRRGRSGQR